MSDLISRSVVIRYLQEQSANIIREKHNEFSIASYDTIRGMEAAAEAFMNFIVQMPDVSDANAGKDEPVSNSNKLDDGWIPVEERLPENAQHKGAFCPKYDVLTKYGATIGWYNPDFESWYVLIWFMTDRFLETEIDFERGDVPKVVRVPLGTKIVTAWKTMED